MPEAKKYPWLRLLELELAKERPAPPKRRGRPRNAFQRIRVGASMTQDELTALEELVDLLRSRFGKSVHRGHLIAFMTFQLRTRLQGSGRKVDLPAGIDSFVSLAEYLEGR
jgi:predicted ArsR family transcriptional regulator